ERWCSAKGWDLRTLPPSGVAAYVDTLPRTWATRNVVRAALARYWVFTKRRNPPLAAIRVPPKPRMVCRALEPGDARILAKAARELGGPQGLAVVLGLYLGLRREEVATLRWDAFRDGWVTIVGKGDRSRSLPVSPKVAELLAAHPRRSEVWVFPGRGRPHITPSTVWEWTRTVAVLAGVGAVPPHVLRHTCLATANDTTGDLRSTQDWAGHTRPETTAGYTRTTARRLKSVMMSIDYEAAAAHLDDEED
ncbi:MAG: tyrosine-type recombinase/integrase, partial [Acidimicrobiales bacterium]